MSASIKLKALCLLYVHLIINISHSQELDTIELPFSERPNLLDESFFDKIIDIHIQDSGKVHINNQEISDLNQFAAVILAIDKKSGFIDIFRSKLVLSIDKDTPYSFVSLVKEELAKTYKKNLFYKKNTRDSLRKFVYENSRNFNHKLPMDLTKESKEVDRFKVTKIYGEELVLPTNDSLVRDEGDSLIRALYELDADKINEISQKIQFQTITLLPNRNFAYMGENHELSDLDILHEKVNSGNIILVTFHKTLLYGDYIRYLEKKNDIFHLTKQKQFFKRAFIEIPPWLESALSNQNILPK